MLAIKEKKQQQLSALFNLITQCVLWWALATVLLAFGIKDSKRERERTCQAAVPIAECN